MKVFKPVLRSVYPLSNLLSHMCMETHMREKRVLSRDTMSDVQGSSAAYALLILATSDKPWKIHNYNDSLILHHDVYVAGKYARQIIDHNIDILSIPVIKDISTLYMYDSEYNQELILLRPYMYQLISDMRPFLSRGIRDTHCVSSEDTLTHQRH